MIMLDKTNQFEAIWSKGYRRLCPIIPPGAPISDRSNIKKRIAAGDDARGKIPGTKWPDGTWAGFDFVAHESTGQDVARWHAMGAGVGIKTGNGLVLIDADTKNPEWADKIKTAIHTMFGDLPVRIGNYPKAGYLCRTDADFQYTRIEFGERNAKGSLQDRIEILAEGRQFVAHGIHPTTNQPYRWPAGVPNYEELPFIPGTQLLALLEAVKPFLPAASEIVKEGAATDIDQNSLRLPIDTLREVVKATRNTSAQFPTREAYRDYGYAIKAAAGPEHETDALELYQEWAQRWEDGENDPDVVEADWRRMKGPFRVGGSKLIEHAGDAGKTISANMWAEPDWKPAEHSESLFETSPPSSQNSSKPLLTATPYSWVEPSKIQKRQEIYGQHYYRKFVSATVAPSGVGKTALKIVEALAIASGKPLLGVTPKVHGTVWLWNGEDPIDELERRAAAAIMHYGITPEDIGDRFYLDTGREQEIIMATIGKDGTQLAKPMAEAVVAAIRARSVDVMIIDPFISSHRVPENDNPAIDLVTKQWAKISDLTQSAIELVHHVRKLNGSDVTVEDSRGAGALLATSRSAKALSKMSRAEATKLGLDPDIRPYFKFGDAKNNLALVKAGGESEWFHLKSVQLGNGEGADAFERAADGDSVGVVTIAKLDAVVSNSGDRNQQAELVSLIDAGEWKRDVRAGDAWAGRAIAMAYGYDLDEDEDKGKVKQILKALLKENVLKEEMRYDAKNKNNRLYVVSNIQSVEKGAFE